MSSMDEPSLIVDTPSIVFRITRPLKVSAETEPFIFLSADIVQYVNPAIALRMRPTWYHVNADVMYPPPDIFYPAIGRCNECFFASGASWQVY